LGEGKRGLLSNINGWLGAKDQNFCWNSGQITFVIFYFFFSKFSMLLALFVVTQNHKINSRKKLPVGIYKPVMYYLFQEIFFQKKSGQPRLAETRLAECPFGRNSFDSFRPKLICPKNGRKFNKS
jgi:hypothetical protein